MKRIIFYGIICVLTAFILSSCINQASMDTENPESESFVSTEAELAEFTLIRPEFAEDYVIHAAQTLRKNIEEKSGVRLSLKSDWVKPGEEIPVGTQEILIGSTNRPESGSIGPGEYRVEYINGRIIIQGGDEASMAQAVMWFVENCIDEKLILPLAPYGWEIEYPLENTVLNGIPLGEYSVEDADDIYYCDMYLRQWLIENTGCVSENSNMKIRFVKNSSLTFEEIAFVPDEYGLRIETSEEGQSPLNALEVLMERISDGQTNDIILNEVVKMDEKYEFGSRIRKKLQMDYAELCTNGPINIVAFGDSVTHGAVGPGEFDYESVYWNRLKKKIHSVRNYVPVNVINAGIGGITAKDSIGRMDEQVLDHHPDLVIVCFGLNDVNGLLEDYLSALGEIFMRCRQTGTDVIFMTPNMLNTYVGDKVAAQHYEYAHQTAEMQNNGRFDQYIYAAVDLAKEMGVEVCDCYSIWKEMSKTEDTTSLLANGINHPIREMHELFADELFYSIFGREFNSNNKGAEK